MEKKKKYESQRLADSRWQRANTKSVTIKFYLKTDKDILEHLEQIENRNAYLKQLIREDINRRSSEIGSPAAIEKSEKTENE